MPDHAQDPYDAPSTYMIPVRAGESVLLEGDFPINEAEWNQFMAVLVAMKPGLVAEHPDAHVVGVHRPCNDCTFDKVCMKCGALWPCDVAVDSGLVHKFPLNRLSEPPQQSNHSQTEAEDA